MATGRISNETRKTILEMSASGHSAEDISEMVGRTLSSVRNIIEGQAKAAPPSRKAAGKKASSPARTVRSRPSVLADTLTHHFWLRPALEITLELPSDLSPEEANRLASVVQSLPFQG